MNTLDICNVLNRTWWALVVRGLVAVAFGVAAALQPAITLRALVLLFGAFALVDGLFAIWIAVAGRKGNESWRTLLLWGLAGTGIGALTLVDPGVTAMALLYYVALWAVATGVIEIETAIRLRKEIKGEILLVAVGLASVGLGALIAARPGASALALTWLLAVYSVFFGLVLMTLAYRVRSVMRKL